MAYRCRWRWSDWRRARSSFNMHAICKCGTEHDLVLLNGVDTAQARGRAACCIGLTIARFLLLIQHARNMQMRSELGQLLANIGTEDYNLLLIQHA